MFCKGCTICKNNKSICYCYKCNKYLCKTCCIPHKKPYFFDCEIKGYNEKCKEHQKIKNIICTQCNINTCLICYNKKHKGHIKTSLDDYYKSIKNKYYKSLTQYIKQITKDFNITNKQLLSSFKECYTLFSNSFVNTAKFSNYSIITSFKNCFTLIKPKYHFNCNGLNIKYLFVRYDTDISSIEFDDTRAEPNTNKTPTISIIAILDNKNIFICFDSTMPKKDYDKFAIYDPTFHHCLYQEYIDFCGYSLIALETINIYYSAVTHVLYTKLRTNLYVF